MIQVKSINCEMNKYDKTYKYEDIKSVWNAHDIVSVA